jgi:prepilin-type N-terminal cleavage/methylation domain-containing protein
MKPPSSRSRAFTLIEMLVSVTIMSFMLILMSQIVGQTQSIWRAAQMRIDNFNKARSMLDLITDDLQRGVFRGDLPAFGTGAPAATPAATDTGLHYFTQTSFTNAFYTRRPGGGSGAAGAMRDISLVSYALNASAQGDDKIVLQRSDLGVPWTNAQENISFQKDMTALLQNATPREVAPGVVGFRMLFRRADGSLIDQRDYTGYDAENPVVAINFGLAVLGKESLSQLSGDQVAEIETRFSGAQIKGGIKASWDENVLTSAFYQAYPASLGSGLKTFERWVACPPF